MAYAKAITITPATITDLTVIIKDILQVNPVTRITVLTLDDFEVSGDYLSGHIRVINSEATVSIYPQGYEPIITTWDDLSTEISLVPTNDYFRTSDGTNNYYVKDDFGRKFENDLLTIATSNADNTLSNVSSIDSNSAVQTALDGKANTSLSNLDSTGQAVIDGKVSKSGDTMTGDLTILCDNDSNGNLIIQNTDVDFVNGVSATRNTYFTFKDVNNVIISEFQNHFTATQNRMTMRVRPWGDTTTASSALPGLFLDANSDGSLVAQFSGMTEFKFPKSYNVDGQWTYVNQEICQGRTSETSDKSWTLSLPSDSYNYEVLLTGAVTTGTTSGNQTRIGLQSTIITTNIVMCNAQTRTSSSVTSYGACILPVGSNHKLTVSGWSSNTGAYSLYLRGYRRIGTNS